MIFVMLAGLLLSSGAFAEVILAVSIVRIAPIDGESLQVKSDTQRRSNRRPAPTSQNSLGNPTALLAEDDNHEQHNRSRNGNGNDQAGPRSHHANHARLKPRCSECARNQQGGRKHHAEHGKRLAPP